MNTDVVLTTMRQLNDKERQQAWDKARDKVAGKQPKRDDVSMDEAYSKTTRALTYLGIVGLFFFTWIASAIRIHDVALTVALETVGHRASAGWIAVAIVMMSELGMIVFLTASSVLTINWKSKAVLSLAAILSAVIAIAGNVTSAQIPGFKDPYFAVSFLEAIAPPMITLGTAFVLERMILSGQERDRKRAANYRKAVEQWQAVYDNPESHGDWGLRYVGALKDRIYRANASKAQIAVRNALSQSDWIALVQRELNKDAQLQALYADVTASEQQSAPQKHRKSTPQKHRKSAPQSSNGHTPQVIEGGIDATQTADGTWVANCPYDCDYRAEKDNPESAKNSVRAHMKVHVRRGEMLPVSQN